MEHLQEAISFIGLVVTYVLMPVLGGLLFYDARRRKASAEASKAESDNITSYAAEWKELYEKKEHRVTEQDAKIDRLYAQINDDRQRIRELMEKNTELELKNQMLEVMKCKKRGCPSREPPSDY